jgi:tetratricopeptide (TPR) repeat protein
MRGNFLYRTFVTAVAVSLLAGCEAAHKEYVKPHEDAFAATRANMLYQAAEQQYKVGELTKCRESLKKAIEADPTHPYAPLFVLTGRVELEGGSLERAATALKKAVEIDGKNAEAHYLLGVVYQRWQKFDEASAYYTQAADKKPEEATYAVAAAEMLIANGQLEEAKEFLSTKMYYFEQSAAMRIALARIATLQGDAAGAARNYRDAALLLPEDKNLSFNYALALFDAGKYSEASKILEALRYDPPTLPKARKASPEDAETDARAAVSNKVSLLVTLGECYVSMKRPIDARDCFQEAIRAQPASVTAFLSLGKTCLITHEYPIVVEAADRVLRLDPRNVDAMILQAAVQQKEKKWNEAMVTLAGAAKIAPKDPTVLCMSGISAMQLGKKDYAATFFELALAAKPGDAWAGELLESVRPAAPAPAAVPSEPVSISAAEETAKNSGTPWPESLALTLSTRAAGLVIVTDGEIGVALATSAGDVLTSALPSRGDGQ